MFFTLEATDTTATTVSFNSQYQYNLTLSLTNPDVTFTTSLDQFMTLTPMRPQIQGETIPVPIDSTLNAVMLTQTSLKINNGVRPLTSGDWWSNMQASPGQVPSGFNSMVWGLGSNPQSNSSGTLFRSAAIVDWPPYTGAGSQYITSSTYNLVGPYDGFSMQGSTNVSYNGYYETMVAFASDQCPATNTDVEYGYVFTGTDQYGQVVAYVQHSGGSWDYDVFYANTPPMQNQYWQAWADASATHMSFYEQGVLIVTKPLPTMGTSDCVTLGFNSDGPYQFPIADPLWYLFTNGVSLWYG